MKLSIIILLLSVLVLDVYCQKKLKPEIQGAWVIKQVKLRDTGGWHTVTGIADIIDFENDSVLTIKEIGSSELKKKEYRNDQSGKLKISNGSTYQLKITSDSSLILDDHGNEFTYTALLSTKNLISTDSAVNYFLSSPWSYDTISHKRRLHFSTDKFLVGEFDTGLMRFTESLNTGEKNQGGWFINNYKCTLLLTIFPSTSYRKTTYQVEEVTEKYIKAIGWQDGLKTEIEIYRL